MSPIFLSGNSKVSEFARKIDWASHPLGHPDTWNSELKTTTSLMLSSAFPMFVAWGEKRTILYNDAYGKILGEKHPDAFGQPFEEVWSENWSELLPLVKRVDQGETVYLENLKLMVRRSSQDELSEAYFTFSYSPIRDERGRVQGLFCSVVETTTEFTTKNQLELSEAKYRTLFHSVDQGFCILEMIYDEADEPVDYRFIEVNPMFEKQTGLIDAQGKRVSELVPDLDDFWFKTYRKVAKSGKAIRFEQEAPAMGRIFDVFAFRIADDQFNRVGLLFSDITEKKIAQLEYERSVDVSPAILWITEVDGSCSYLSKQWYQYTGQTEEEALGFGWLNATHPDDKEKTANIYLNANREQRPFYCEYRLKTHDGSYRWAIDAGNPRYDKYGKYLGYAGTVFDIHERKLAEEAAEKAQEQTLKEWITFQEVLNQTTIPIALLEGPDHRFTFTNDAYNDAFGFTSSPIGKLAGEVFPDAFAQGFGNLLDKVYRTGETFRGTEIFFERQSPGGEKKEFFIDFTYAAKRNTNGEIHGVLAAIVDVSEKVIARRSIEESRHVLKTITDNAASSLFMMDKAGRPTFMNPSAERLTGYKLEEIKDRPLHYAVHYKRPDGTHYPMEECPIDNAQSTMKVVQNQEEVFVDKSGRLFPVSFSVSPLQADGEVSGSVLEFQDISKQKESEQALVLARDEAERANQLKSAFLANMSHEIRTPLGAMIGFADLLRDPGLSETERINYIDILSRNGENLSLIINDILDLSKVEAGHLTLEYTDAYPDQIAADVVSLLRVKAKEKDLTLDYTYDESSPRSIVSDPLRVRQILLNLVGNAIKFTQYGSVKIRSYGCKTDDGRPAVCFEVADTGIGIPTSQQDRIFEMFVQADGTMTRRFGGTGLGLALSRRLARSMGGDVSVIKTQEGVGTTFLVKIEDQPHRRTSRSLGPSREKTAVIEIKDRALEGIRVLVVDDAPDNQQLIWRYLTKQGALIETAENGWIGYRAALGGNFDIVLMDIQMPVMDGYTATQKLRENGFSQPIIALTAHAMTEIRKKCLNVGCNAQLTKPINPKELIHTIATFVGR